MHLDKLARQGLLLLGLAVLVLPQTSSRAATAQDGWRALWGNDPVAAQKAFKTTLKASPADSSALLGLALLRHAEDADAAALQSWTRLVRSSPSHWAAQAYWPWMAQIAEDTGRWTQFEGAAQAVVAAKGVAPELRASAMRMLALAAERRQKKAEAARLWSSLGYVTAWNVVGPFENVSRSGFAKPFAPESGVDFGANLVGKDELGLKWRRLALTAQTGLCDIGAALGDREPNAYYAATGIYSPKSQKGVLALDPQGATKLWLNGRLVLSDATYRKMPPCVADVYRLPVTLEQGWNTLLLKAADLDESSTAAAFRLRVCGTGWETLPGLKVDPAHGARAGSAEARDLPTPPLAILATLRAGRAPSSAEAALAEAELGALTADYRGAERTLRDAISGSPSAALLHWCLSQVLKSDELEDDARAERDAALKLWPSLVPAKVALLDDENVSAAASEKLASLKALAKSHPSSPLVLWALADAYDESQMMPDSLKAARLAMAQGAGAKRVSHLAYMLLGSDRYADAEKVVVDGLKMLPADPTLLRRLASAQKSQGRLKEALANYQRALEADPTSLLLLNLIADLQREMKNLKASAATLQLAAARSPQDAELRTTLGDTLRDLGRTPEAIAQYREAIRLDPSRVSLREKLQVLLKERPVLDLVPAAKPEPYLAAAKSASSSETGAVVLLDEARQVVYPDAASLTRHHLIVKVLDDAAVKSFSTLNLDVSSSTADATVESARLIKADGKVQKITDSYDGSVSFPSLAPGDTCDVSYRVEDYHPGALARYFWTEWRFSRDAHPVNLTRFVLITPKGMPYEARAHGAVPQPTEKTAGNWLIREWKQENVPASPAEPMAVAAAERTPWIDISSVPSWGHVVRWYQDLSGPLCLADEAVKAKAAELSRGATTEEAKLRAITRFVSKQIEYQSTPFRNSAFIPTEGKKVLNERYGDCKDKAALIAALANAVGIKAEMVLLSGRSEGLVPYLPSPRFNHAIARVMTEKGPLWVDGTAEDLAFGCLPSEDQGVPALLINDGSKGLVTSPVLPSDQMLARLQEHFVLDENGKLTCESTCTYSGFAAWVFRSILSQVPKDKRDLLYRTLVSSFAPNAAYLKGSIENLPDPEKPITLSVSFRVDNAATQAGSFTVLKLPSSFLSDESISRARTTKPRTQDLEAILARSHEVATTRVDLPPGLVPQDLKPDTIKQTPWGTYRVRQYMDGTTLVIELELESTQTRIPASEVAGFLDFMSAKEQASRGSIVLKRG